MKNYPLLTDAEIDWLISIPKAITTWKRRTERGHRVDESDIGEVPPNATRRGKFGIRARQSIQYPDNFSVALTYEDFGDCDVVNLLRLNGRHRGGHSLLIPPLTPHIHRASAEAISVARTSNRDPEHEALTTNRYASVDEAFSVLAELANISQPGHLFASLPARS